MRTWFNVEQAGIKPSAHGVREESPSTNKSRAIHPFAKEQILCKFAQVRLESWQTHRTEDPGHTAEGTVMPAAAVGSVLIWIGLERIEHPREESTYGSERIDNRSRQHRKKGTPLNIAIRKGETDQENQRYEYDADDYLTEGPRADSLPDQRRNMYLARH